MILLVCGGRDYFNKDRIHRILERFNKEKGISLLVQGGCKGVDLIAKNWATTNGIHTAQIDALWDWYREQGNVHVAGYERNKAMALLNIDYCIGIEGGKGTEMMCKLMRDKGVKTVIFKNK